MKTKECFHLDGGNALYAMACIMDDDFDSVTGEPVNVGPKCNKPKTSFNPMNDVGK